ncbi:MAG: MgtC/SapB family protein [Halofilum sp. (in: g-proteobacteria)]
MPFDQPMFALLSALAIGLLIGVERGFAQRDVGEGQRIAGLRTYALLGLLGGMVGVLSLAGGAAVIVAGIVAVTAIIVAAYVMGFRMADADMDVGITSAVASLTTFVLAMLAGRGNLELAGAGAVMTVLLLGLKPELHGSLQRISRDELKGVFKLLVLSVVLLPVLPDQNYGPWGTLNPRAIWWLVVLIAALSFAGYVAVRAFGPTRGILATGLFGGLASSTALTVHFARLSRRGSDIAPILSGGVLLASTSMSLRTLVIVAAVDWRLLPALLPPLVVMGLIGVTSALWLARRDPGATTAQVSALSSPVAITPALVLGLILAVILVATAAAREWFGATGVLAIAMISGISNIDAIAVSMSQMAAPNGPQALAAAGIIAATTTNSVAKIIMARVIGGPELARYAGPPLVLTALVGAIATVLLLRGVLPVDFT